MDAPARSVTCRTRPLPAIVPIGLVVVVGAVLAGHGFTSARNIANLGLQASILLMLAMPMTLIIMSEGLDLSAGAVLSLCSVVMAMMLAGGHGLVAALAASLGVGLMFGLANGGLVSLLGLPPFVVTLGTLGIAQGAALVLTDGNAVSGLGSRHLGALRRSHRRRAVARHHRARHLARDARAAVPHALRCLRIRDRRQSRCAGARGRTRLGMARRHLRAMAGWFRASPRCC